MRVEIQYIIEKSDFKTEDEFTKFIINFFSRNFTKAGKLKKNMNHNMLFNSLKMESGFIVKPDILKKFNLVEQARIAVNSLTLKELE